MRTGIALWFLYNCKWVRPAVGVALCAVAAEGLTLAFDSTPFTVFLPLIFLGIIILVALRFGNASGVIGTIVAALTFAVFLFEPTLSLEVKNSAERSNLIWMVVGGVAIRACRRTFSKDRPQAAKTDLTPPAYGGTMRARARR